MKLIASALTVLIGLNFSGCSKGNDAPEAPNVQHLGEDHSCDYKAQEGQPVAGYRANLQTLMFGKIFDKGHFDAVANASAVDTAAYIHANLETNVYNVDTEVVGNCDYFSFLQQPPEDIRAFFNSLTSPGQGYFIAGLFLPKNFPGLSSTFGTNTILVMKTNDRWTLVHEMMHDLFAHQRAQENHRVANSNLIADQMDADQKTLAAIADRSSPAYVEALADVEDDAYEIITDYPLEEVTIETNLTKLYKNGSLTYAPYSRRSSVGYINISLERAQRLLSTYARFLRRNTATTSSVRQGQTHARLATLDRQVADAAYSAEHLTSSNGAIALSLSEIMPLDEHLKIMMDQTDAAEAILNRQ